MDKKSKPGFWIQLQRRYKLSFFNENTLEEVWTIHLSRLTAIIAAVLIVAVIVALVLMFVLGTPARTLLPGYLRSEDRVQILDYTLRIDSLINEMSIRDRYLANIEAVLTGSIVTGSDSDTVACATDSATVWQPEILTKASAETQAFAQAYEQEERFMLSTLPAHEEGILFHTPVKGKIVTRYAPDKGMYGIEIQASRHDAVSAVLDGTVVAVTPTIENGYVIAIQHNNNYMSIYRNMAAPLRKTGDSVAAGEKIAVIGTAGSTGNSIVEFELWHAGKSLNPEEHIPL